MDKTIFVSLRFEIMDFERIREDFPILRKEIEGKPIIYFDSACQSLRPKQVLEAMNRYYEDFPACAGRSIHKLATEVSIRIDEARGKLARFVNAEKPEEISFVRNCTEALNTVIFGVGLKKGDVVLATDREHNSVHVPLLKLKETTGIDYQIVPSRDDETFNLDKFSEIAAESRPRLVAMCHTSNVNGTTIPAKEVCKIAHENGALVLLDGAQYVPYGGVDIKDIDTDFYAFSAHKMCGPSGVGILTGKYDELSKIEPRTYGGHGISMATRKHADILPPPERFEAGLQNYSGIIGTGAAADYLSRIGRDWIVTHVNHLNRMATEQLLKIPDLKIIEPGNPDLRSGILAFNIKKRNPHDIAMILDNMENIMIRSGMHCSHSWFNDREIEGSARASFYLYNTKDEISLFADTLRRLQ
ncbi:MAG: aminotransferase class V-fold PLP-dependent enzyme [Thermoplasmata archaeon]|nr:aminotransferase class V-fold PLP-dependent enzyme [Thermoplasmata archaeon]